MEIKITHPTIIEYIYRGRRVTNLYMHSDSYIPNLHETVAIDDTGYSVKDKMYNLNTNTLYVYLDNK